MKVVINRCFGGFGLSDAAYKRLIELGVPVRKYIEQQRSPETGLYLPEPRNDGEVIFERDPDDEFAAMSRLMGTDYWDAWTRESRNHPLVVQVVEELGKAANGRCADLQVVEIPDGIDWSIDEYDGIEHIAEAHRTWS